MSLWTADRATKATTEDLAKTWAIFHQAHGWLMTSPWDSTRHAEDLLNDWQIVEDELVKRGVLDPEEEDHTYTLADVLPSEFIY